MLKFLEGVVALLAVISSFSLFSMKCPSGEKAMSGVANAAVCTFLVEALFKYILGDFCGIEFFGTVGSLAGSMSGPAAALLVGISMGTDPIFATASAVATSGFGILPGFIAGYCIHFVICKVEKKIPSGIDTICCALIAAAGSYGIAAITNPFVTKMLVIIGTAIEEATKVSPVWMGFILGGMMKVICTSPLSSMALTAMLNLTGLPMGISAIACFGGAFSNFIVFRTLNMGTKANATAVLLEPLTQANIITANPVPVYLSSFLGGAFSGIGAAILNIVDNAPGTASPIPGLLAPFAFNPPGTVIIALIFAAGAGCLGGWLVGSLFKRMNYKVVVAL